MRVSKANNKLTIFSANANSLKNKMDSLKFVVANLDPQIIVIQETKLKRKTQCPLDGYEPFHSIRGDSGGGILVACKFNLSPTRIFEGDKECEVLVVQIKMAEIDIRIIAGYGAQECAPVVVREKYRSTIEEQVVRAQLAGCEIIIAEDANSKLGPNIIPNDPHPMSENGKLLDGMIRRQRLIIVNNSEKCVGGPITRKRFVNRKIEESCIDFVLASEALGKTLLQAAIDKPQVYALTKYSSTKGNPCVKRSDHYSIIATFSIKEKSPMHIQEEIFKLRDKDGLERFRQMTDNNPNLRQYFQSNENIEESCGRWYKHIDKIIHQCFKKVRLTGKPPKKTMDYDILKGMQDLKILKEIKEVSSDMLKPILNLEITNLENLISSLQGDKCKKIMFQDMRELVIDGAFSLNNAWKLKKKLFPRCSDSPFALNDKNGNLVADYDGILEVMKEEFVFRLRNREMKDEYLELKELKEYLCQLRLRITKNSDFQKWSMQQLIKAVAKLKNNKCKDPHGHINELYKSMGEDGMKSLLDMLNQIKLEIIIPSKLNVSNVSTIYKGKGSMHDVLNLRGIFKLPIIRNILDSLVYSDEQEQVCASMGPFQVGNQKGRNIRDNTLVLHAAINEVQANKTCMDIQFTDIKQCFDSIWLDEATNDLFDSGLNTRNLNLLYEGNRKTRMCVETQFGRTDRAELTKVVMQGSVPGGLFCSNQLVKLCHKLYKDGDVYMYHNKVPIPALAMVDDIANIAVCNSVTAIKANVKTDSFIQRKKLEGQVGDGKCQWVHIGSGECRSKYVINGTDMTQAMEYKYLGDQVANCWKVLYNKRWEKAQGYSATVQAMCTEMSLGFHIYKIAKMLHASIFVNGTLVNMETWPNCTEERIQSFERIEQSFFRKILQAHSKTPIEAIYLELGVLPLRYHLIKKRLSYFREVMDRADDELTKMIVVAQMERCEEGDFVAQVNVDMDRIGVNSTEILSASKVGLGDILNRKIQYCAFNELIAKAASHSKVKEDIYSNLEGAPHYNNSKFTPDLCNLIFRFRTRTFLVKNNFRNNYVNTNILCPLCETCEDNQGHVFQCVKILEKADQEIDCDIDDIFCEDEEKLFTVATTLKRLVNIREMLIEPEEADNALENESNVSC